jgi:hypothetical protein
MTVNNEQEGMRKEAVETEYESLSQNFLGGHEKSHLNPFINVGVPSDIRSRQLSSVNQKHYIIRLMKIWGQRYSHYLLLK